jgi:hypothetical protein
MAPPPRHTHNRRAALRTRFTRGGTCRLVAPPDYRCRAAIVQDVSRSGVGLVLAEPLPVGSVLAIRSAGPAGADKVIGLSVRHITPLGEGRWLLGCDHAQDLAPDEVRALLDALRAPRE